MLLFFLVTIVLFLLPDVLINRFTPKAPLPSDLEAWQLTLTGQSHDRTRMHTKQFGHFVSIKDFFHHFHAPSFLCSLYGHEIGQSRSTARLQGRRAMALS